MDLKQIITRLQIDNERLAYEKRKLEKELKKMNEENKKLRILLRKKAPIS